MTNERLLSINDIYGVQLGIMKEFHNWCIENNIRYSITYGTLIGQIRYQGFIPWDNDVDIMMPRPDSQKLVNFYRKETI